MKGTLDLSVTRVLEAGGLALVVGTWSFAGTGADGEPVKLTGNNADVLRRQADGSLALRDRQPLGYGLSFAEFTASPPGFGPL